VPPVGSAGSNRLFVPERPLMPEWVKQARVHLGTQNSNGVSGTRSVPDGGTLVPPGIANENPSDGFAKLLFDEVRNVNQMQTTATNNVHSLLTGGDVNEAEVLTSVQKADLAFRMLLQVRNKLMDAYREIQQIQI
jgi:flagellar hook-basal body complex protein FliE